MGGADDWLPLSGIQHFCFCRRQWALIHLEQQWAENRRTVEGQLDHARCHDANQTERRGGLLITRGTHPTLSVAYYPSIDTWNGRDKLQINIQSYF